jgi:replicative DNA helicase
MQIATANASQGNPTMFFSLEMSRDQLGDRILCAESHVEVVQDSKALAE